MLNILYLDVKHLHNTMNNKITIYCQIKAIQAGMYTNIVVEDLTRELTDPLKFVTVVKCPN